MSSNRPRVRAVLTTPDGDVLTIRRVKPDRPVYWTLPGGHVEPGDTDLAAALRRELAEEVGGRSVIDRLFHVTDDEQYFYLGRVEDWTGLAPDSPELADPSGGEYRLEAVPVASLAAIDLKPEPVARLLAEHAARPLGLAGLPRVTRSAVVPLR